MKIDFVSLSLVLGLGFVLPAVAQENPAKEEPAKREEAVKPEAPKEEAVKEEAAAPAIEALPVAAPAKELSSCAKSFVPLADSYKKAYDDMEKWIAQIDAQTSAAGGKSMKLQEQIQQNETAITKAKFDKDDAKVKSLTKDNKQLWTDFNAAKKDQDKICGGFSKEASDRAKQNSDAINKALADLKAQGK